MNIRKLYAIILVFIAAVGFAGCSNGKNDTKQTVKVGVVGEANEMWDPVIEKLKGENINIELVSFTDYSTPNRALNDGDVDLNAFQHHAYLDKEVEDNGYQIVSIADTFISAMNIFSNKVSSVDQIKEKDKIAIPNDATNGGRALKVLEGAGLIKLDQQAGNSPEKKDITENKLNLELVEVDAANVYSLLPDVAAAVINCNYALDNGLNPGKDAIFQDNVNIYSDNSYINLIAARTKDVNNEGYKKIIEAYQSEAVKKVFTDVYKDSYIPAWKE